MKVDKNLTILDWIKLSARQNLGSLSQRGRRKGAENTDAPDVFILNTMGEIQEDSNETIYTPESRPETNELEPSSFQSTEKPTQVNITLSLEIGARIHLTIEALDRSSDPTSSHVLVQTSSDIGKEAVAINIVASPDTRVELTQDIPSSGLNSSILDHRLESFGNQVKAMPLARYITLEGVLFVLSLGTYLVTRLIGLEKFPIYFFTDEAIHTVLAESLVNNSFRYGDVFLPTYFPMGATFGLNSLSVYLQIIPYLLFGKSIFVTRATSVLVTVLGASAVGLSMRNYFKSRYWWSVILLLSITPTWFLHSRTAFENVEVASFYACFLYFYLGYRLKSPRYLYPAILFGALAFYTHGLGQPLMASTVLLLLAIDIPYHWQKRRTVLIGFALAVILAVPYLRFTLSQSDELRAQLRQRSSYWIDQPIPVGEKLVRFGKQYLAGINPLYWYLPVNRHDLARHLMKGYGHILLPGLFFALYGLWLTIKNWRSPPHRVLLAALLAGPVGAALVEYSILRLIWMVIPLTLLTCLGLTAILDRLERPRISRVTISVILFVILAGINIFMLVDSLKNGPLWYKDYSLYGMQYGAKQLFREAIPEYLSKDPKSTLIVSSIWANGTDNFTRFFLTPEQQARVRLDSIDTFLFEKQILDDSMILGLTLPEYNKAKESPKFEYVIVDRVIDYPDGTPGFYFVRMAYSDDADSLFAAEKEARQKPVEQELEIDGQPVKVTYSQIDGGQLIDIFDGSFFTLMRGLEANPFLLDLEFSHPRQLDRLEADFGTMDFKLTASLYSETGSEPVVYETLMRNVTTDPHVKMIFDRGPAEVSKLRLLIQSFSGGDNTHIHIRDIDLQP